MSTVFTTKKPKPARKRVSAPTKGVHFQSRGKYRCVRVDGASRQGLHNALDRVLGKVDREHGRLTVLPLPAPDLVLHEPRPQQTPTRQGPPQNALKQGSRLDREESRTIMTSVYVSVPDKAWFAKET